MPKQRVNKRIEKNEQKENETVHRARKRKATSPLSGGLSRKRTVLGEHNPQPLRERNQQTDQLFKEMGVKFISQTGLDTVDPKETTPALWTIDGCQEEPICSQLPIVPGAPRILLNCPTHNMVSNKVESPDREPDSTPIQKKYLSLDTTVRPHRKQQEGKGFDCFSILSDEMILSIYHWLPRCVLAKCARVCKRWSRLVQDESLWKRIDLSNKTLAEGVLGCILNRGVWALRLAKSEIESPVFLPQSFTRTELRISKLHYLDLSMAGVSTDVLEELFDVCRDLRKLSLENVELNEKICRCIGRNRDLEVLNMAMCQGITRDGLMAIVTNCERLEALHVGWTSLCRQSIVVLCLCLPDSIIKLNFSGNRENLSDEDILHLCKTCPNLRELDLSDSTSLTCQSIIAIANSLRHLEYLALSRCYHVIPNTILQLRSLPKLAAVDVFGMLREGPLEQLKENMPNIEINSFPFSSIARPTTGIRRTSIWSVRVRENFV